MKELVCICCPRGCRLQVDETAGYTVTGHSCQRGAEYGRNECLHPVRVVTTTVAVAEGELSRCPVKTAQPVPKDKVFAVMAALEGLVVPAPITLGQVILPDAAGTGAALIATRAIQKQE